jgi:hypothetical protein
MRSSSARPGKRRRARRRAQPIPKTVLAGTAIATTSTVR